VAINKSQTPVWMKAVLILLAIVFVFGFVSIGASPFMTDDTQEPAAAGSLDAINQQFAPTVAAVTSQLQTDPENFDLLVNLGNTYFDWAAQVQQAAQTDAANAGVDQPLWVAAKDAYGRAVAIDATNPPVTVDYAIVLFYTGETAKAIEMASAIAKSNPEFAMAWYNLGIFHKALGETEEAIAGFERYLELDPKGESGNLEFAKSELATLKGEGGTTATPGAAAPGSTPATLNP